MPVGVADLIKLDAQVFQNLSGVVQRLALESEHLPVGIVDVLIDVKRFVQNLPVVGNQENLAGKRGYLVNHFRFNAGLRQQNFPVKDFREFFPRHVTARHRGSVDAREIYRLG